MYTSMNWMRMVRLHFTLPLKMEMKKWYESKNMEMMGDGAML
jgi:hypothetical protein